MDAFDPANTNNRTIIVGDDGHSVIVKRGETHPTLGHDVAACIAFEIHALNDPHEILARAQDVLDRMREERWGQP